MNSNNNLQRHLVAFDLYITLGLETKVTAWTSAKKTYSHIDIYNEMKQLKDTEAPWLSDCPSQALQS